ncbi:hypothetical protein GOC13_24415 [Sinorhizobium meliloti]|nr:hypothetical protein [Sinorhizobium meliloti]
MAAPILSFVIYSGDGSKVKFTFNFPYLSRDHIKVLVDGVETGSYTWTGTNEITLTTAPATGKKVTIKRVTPNAGLLSQIIDGSTLRSEDINRQAKQAMYSAQEAADIATLAVTGTLAAPTSDAGRVTLQFPSIEVRANGILGFDENGQFRAFTGEDMPKGPQGDKGPTGDQGPVGPDGIQGPQGPQGIVGPQGPQGIPGIQGPQGFQGDIGPIGPSFDPDAFGNTAERSAYDTQPKGFAYLDLVQGLMFFKLSSTSGDWSSGVAFGQGPQGIQGVQGPQGVVGPQGPAGTTGPQGIAGPQGVAGSQGPIGATGPAGTPGMIWKGAYSSATAYVVKDVVSYNGASYICIQDGTNRTPSGQPTYWSVVSAKGDTGPQGPQGPTGPTGPQGSTGSTGPQGIQGVKGNTGATGPQGPEGPAGGFDIYTGSSNAATTFPIGHNIFCIDIDNLPRNGSTVPRLDTGDTSRYRNSGTGAILGGTWRVRGIEDQSGVRHALTQRTA